MSTYSYRPIPRSYSAFPPVIKYLLVANGLVFVLQIFFPEVLVSWFALWPIHSGEFVHPYYGVIQRPHFWPWQIVSYAFMHGGFAHLFFNMFALWMFGSRIEMAWGSRRFAYYYAVCVVGAGCVQLVVTSIAALESLPFPTVGASGGVFGILLAFGWMYPRAPVIFLFFPYPIPAKWFVIGYGVFELVLGVTGSQSGVAHFAHLGGMVAGFLLIQYWRGRLFPRSRRTMHW